MIHLSQPPAVPTTTENLVQYRYFFEMLPMYSDPARYQACPVYQLLLVQKVRNLLTVRVESKRHNYKN